MKGKKKLYLFSLLLPIVIMIISLAINKFYPFGFKSVMAIDFNQQFIDMFVFFKNTVSKGDFRSLYYSFTKSIGGNMVGIWSYYLNSPLNLLYVITPLKFINHTTNIIILLRYGLMGLTFTHFIVKRHNGLNYNKWLLLAISTVYALNGYNVSYQVVPIFYDAMWLLPLVLIGVEELLDSEKSYKYVLMLALTIFIQFYMGFMICIFIVMYSIFYLVVKKNEGMKWSEYVVVMIKKEVKLALASLLGVGLISFMFIPNLYNLIYSKATSTGSLKFEWKLQIDPLDIIGKLYMGAFDNNSWSAGPNLPNIYVGSLVLVGVMYYFCRKKYPLKDKIAAFCVIFIFFISMVNEFVSKLWHMGQNPAGFFYRFSWLVPFFFCYLAYLALRDLEDISLTSLVRWAIGILIATIVVTNSNHSFMTNYQIIASVGIMVIVLAILYYGNIKHKELILLAITIIELCANATISQSRIVYNNAYKFDNAVNVIGEAVDKIKPGSDDFYRISKTFYRSKDDPMMLDYPGLTHFSSNLEEETRNLFDALGNNSVDATTFYVGTPFTDAIFAVKYLITNGQYKTTDKEIIDKTYFFPEDVNRLDLVKDANLVDKTERFNIYENKNILPIAFGVSDSIVNIKVEKDKPIDLQSDLYKSISGTNDELFEELIPSKIQLTDMSEIKQGERKFKLNIDGEGKIVYRFTPTTNDPYYVVVPKQLSDYKNEISFNLNGKAVQMRKKYVSDQLVNVADTMANQEQAFEIKVKKKEDIDLTRMKFYRVNTEAVNKMVKSKLEEGLDVTSWGANFIKGNINIKDSSKYVFTSIMYDKGWRIKVDGKKVEPTKVINGLMAFPILPGKHEITMEYMPPGFNLGLILTIVSLLIFIVCKFGLAKFIEEKNGKKQNENLTKKDKKIS